MSTFAIKPCPFCGAAARIRKEMASRAVVRAYRVACPACGARGAAATVQPWHDTRYIAQGQAVKLWNTRKDRPLDHVALIEYTSQWPGVDIQNNVALFNAGQLTEDEAAALIRSGEYSPFLITMPLRQYKSLFLNQHGKPEPAAGHKDREGAG